MLIVDSQVHIWGADTPERPWPRAGAAGRKWVMDQLVALIDRVRPDYLKWDNNFWMNCDRPGHGHGASDGNFSHVRALYDLLGQLRTRYPDLLILMLTVYDDDERIFDAMCAGASGYLLKKTPPVRLLDSIREVASGGAPMSPEVAKRVIALFREIRPPERADCAWQVLL